VPDNRTFGSLARNIDLAKLFFLLSGENPTLPFSELKSILDAEGFNYRVLGKATQVLRIESSLECVESIKTRASMTRICGLELFSCKADLTEILKTAETLDLTQIMKEGETFVVRVKRVMDSALQIGRWKLEQNIGTAIFEKNKNVRVDLRNPETVFIGILTENRFIFGLRLAEIRPKPFVERSPMKRAFFHPTAMPAKLARCMVNLAQPRKSELVLDPFCGTGSFLVEAGLIGCRVLGFDADRRMVKGSRRNLSRYGVETEGLGVADARSLPLLDSSIDCVVTDPPYGISATTLGLRPSDLIKAALSQVIDKIRKKRRVCIAAPKNIEIGKLSEQQGFKHIESHFVYYHRRLTREIAVLERD